MNTPLGPLPFPRLPRIPIGGGAIRTFALILIGLLVVTSSIYTVDPEEIGAVLRFGKYVRSSEPGLHGKLPFGIERVQKVPIQRQLKEEFGFRTLSSVGSRAQYDERSTYRGESHMLTGDLNAAVVDWVVQYRIIDPYHYLFKVRDVRQTFRAMSEAVMRRVVGDRTVNEVLTVGRQEVADLVLLQLQELCNQYETGIAVDQVVLQDVNPPDEVKPSFNEVNTAQQERERLINQAQSEYNQIIPRARGEAEQSIQQAEGYALDRVNRARGDSARFVPLYEQYRLAPEVTRRRIYLETMSRVLPQVEDKVIVDAQIKNLLPLLQLGSPGGER